MKKNILCWYKRSKIEKVLEKTLAKHNLSLSLPKISYRPQTISIERTASIPCEDTPKAIYVNKVYSTDSYDENIWFDLEKNAVSGICMVGDKYSAYCYLHHRDKQFLNLVKKEESLDIYVTEKCSDMVGYGIDGNIEVFTKILVDYWVKKFKK